MASLLRSVLLGITFLAVSPMARAESIVVSGEMMALADVLSNAVEMRLDSATAAQPDFIGPRQLGTPRTILFGDAFSPVVFPVVFDLNDRRRANSQKQRHLVDWTAEVGLVGNSEGKLLLTNEASNVKGISLMDPVMGAEDLLPPAFNTAPLDFTIHLKQSLHARYSVEAPLVNDLLNPELLGKRALARRQAELSTELGDFIPAQRPTARPSVKLPGTALLNTENLSEPMTQTVQFNTGEQSVQFYGWHPKVPAFVTLLPQTQEPWIEEDQSTYNALLGGSLAEIGGQIEILDANLPEMPRRRPVQGSYSRNSFPDAAEQTPLSSLWEWRGLMMGLSTRGGITTFVFAQNSDRHRVEEADVIFQGVDSRGRANLVGRGIVFTRCGRYSIPMEGFIKSDGSRVTFRGVAPVLGRRCKVVGERPYTMALSRITSTSTTLWRIREDEDEEEDQ